MAIDFWMLMRLSIYWILLGLTVLSYLDWQEVIAALSMDGVFSSGKDKSHGLAAAAYMCLLILFWPMLLFDICDNQR